ncbi:MAG: ABC transporter ATP-binding protein [Albidovulum sp.]|nr:ABC transporter ATP-binding protein [Albidovulum sp.]
MSKQFSRGPVILSDIDLTVERGAFMCILGPSGSGKSTMVDLIAGFEPPTAGSIAFDDLPVRGPGPDRLVIFQDIANALFPWLTVLENVEFGLKSRSRDQGTRRAAAIASLELVGLATDKDKFPSELSGGMKQRVQIARGLVMDPHVLIMDEPFAALDAITRRHMQYELKDICRRTGMTVIFVTHDIAEALILASEITVLSAGPEAHIIETFDPGLPDERDPATAEFIVAYRRIESMIGAGQNQAVK